MLVGNCAKLVSCVLKAIARIGFQQALVKFLGREVAGNVIGVLFKSVVSVARLIEIAHIRRVNGAANVLDEVRRTSKAIHSFAYFAVFVKIERASVIFLKHRACAL